MKAMRRLQPILITLGAVVGLIGALGSWIPHPAAGLRVSSFHLFESTKFFPEVSSGTVPLLREAFLLPLLTSALLLALTPLIWNSSRLARWLCPAVAAVVALYSLPMYPAILSAHRNPEFRGQLLLVGSTFVLALLSPLARTAPAGDAKRTCLSLVPNGVYTGKNPGASRIAREPSPVLLCLG